MEVKDEFLDFLTGKGKFKIEKHNYFNFFLPHPGEVMKSLGMNPSMRASVNALCRAQGISSPVSNSTLDNIHKKGVSAKSAKRVLGFMFGHINSEFNLASLEDIATRKPVNHFDLTGIWEAVLLGIRPHINHSYPNSYLSDFLQSRVNVEKQALEIWQQGSVSLDKGLHYYQHGLANSQLTQDEAESFLDVVKKVIAGATIRDLTSEDKLFFIRYKLDFYLSLTASVDVTILNQAIVEHRNETSEDPKYPEIGVFGEIFKCDGRCHFEQFLNYIALISSKRIGSLAKYIEIERNDTGEGVTLEVAKRHRLKEWRQGDTKPSFSTIKQFVHNVFGLGDFDLAVVGRCCLMLDRYHSLMPEVPWSELCNVDTYAKHFNHHWKKAANL